MIGRARPDVPLGRVTAEVETIGRQLARRYSDVEDRVDFTAVLNFNLSFKIEGKAAAAAGAAALDSGACCTVRGRSLPRRAADQVTDTDHGRRR